MLATMQGMMNTRTLLVGVQACTAIKEISVAVPQQDWNQSG